MKYYYSEYEDGYSINYISGTVPSDKILTLPSMINSKNVVYLNTNAFKLVKTWELDTVVLPDNLLIQDNALYEVNTKAYEISPSNSAFTTVDGVLFNKDKTILISYPRLKEGESYEVASSVTSIATNAIYNNLFLTSLTFNGNTYMDYNAISNCYNLRSIIISSTTPYMIGNNNSLNNVSSLFHIYVNDDLVNNYKISNSIYINIYNLILGNSSLS